MVAPWIAPLPAPTYPPKPQCQPGSWLRQPLNTTPPGRGGVPRSRPCRSHRAYIFPAASGVSHFQGVEKVWRNVRTAAGFPNLRLHDLRPSFASVGLARGDALPVIGAILGHADVKTTSRYAHLADDPGKMAADAISKSVHAAFSNSASAGVISLTNRKPRI